MGSLSGVVVSLSPVLFVFLPGPLHKAIEWPHIIGMHSRQVLANGIDLVGVGGDEFDHIGIVLTTTGSQLFRTMAQSVPCRW